METIDFFKNLVWKNLYITVIQGDNNERKADLGSGRAEEVAFQSHNEPQKTWLKDKRWQRIDQPSDQ